MYAGEVDASIILNCPLRFEEKHMRPGRRTKSRKTSGRPWILILLVIAIASGLAILWYVYLPDAPATEHGHIQR